MNEPVSVVSKNLPIVHRIVFDENNESTSSSLNDLITLRSELVSAAPLVIKSLTASLLDATLIALTSLNNSPSDVLLPLLS